jgi:hydroxymethylpyrimidine/phosphomethylpyrimidine kinase
MGRVLIIAGSDSGGGAGVQADIKTVTALGGYAATAITAITVQNTLGVTGVHGVPADIVARQIEAVLSDIGADCIKTGMLGDAATIAVVADCLEAVGVDIPLVLDPVMVAKGGAALLEDAAIATLASRLLPRARLVTPNLPEAARLAGFPVEGEEAMIAAGRALLEKGAGAALVKGGHGAGDEVVDILITRQGPQRFAGPRLVSRHTHGTGCTLASAIAVGLAEGHALEDAVARARRYVMRAIATAPGYGQGHGPLNHGFPCDGSMS